MWYWRLPFVLSKAKVLKVEKADPITFNKIGYPKRLELRQVAFTLYPHTTTLLIPRRGWFAYYKQEIFCTVNTVVTFTDQTTIRYKRQYMVDQVEDAVKMAEKDLIFMLDVYITIDQQRYGKKRGP